MVTVTKEQRSKSRAQSVTFQPGSYQVPASAEIFPSANNPELLMSWGTSENGRQPLNVGKIPDVCFTDKGALKKCTITVTKAGAYTHKLD